MTRATKCYCGTKSWATAHAANLRPRIGARCPTTGALITDIQPRLYGESRKLWAVVEMWQYPGRPDLGSFGGASFLLLPLEIP